MASSTNIVENIIRVYNLVDREIVRNSKGVFPIEKGL